SNFQYTHIMFLQIHQQLCRITVILLFCCTCLTTTSGQQDTSSVYKFTPWWSLTIGAVGTATNAWGVDRKLNKPDLPVERVLALSRDDVPRFDRWALDQDAGRQGEYGKLSDYGMLGGFFTPLLLSLDKDTRKNFGALMLLYFETAAIGANVYAWSPVGPTFIERLRPGAYYEEKGLEYRTEGNRRNSFFSGHVSTSAMGSFYFAKVYTDYHPDLGAKKWLWFGAALVPPLFTGYYRVKALKHFPTDVLMGTAVGAAAGILVPQFHKKLQNKHRFSIFYESDFKGLAWVYRF
ncbi:MAG: phosphatase PAP2 family protein, partial [Bacteroidota bacterium]